jgi:hypothetical protein
MPAVVLLASRQPWSFSVGSAVNSRTPRFPAELVSLESQALNRNMLGDPSARTVDVHIPAGHDGQGLPLLVDLVGSRAAVYPTRIG